MARVLLATDVEPARNQVAARLALEATGHVVEEVHDGFEVLAAVATRRPDVLVLDTSLSGLDGFQVLTRLRRDAALRELP
ncbi:MAG TPA: response regulator, partial [Chloroflexota bacterium]|nr:response regulator [Chloroflexota bacterium]